MENRVRETEKEARSCQDLRETTKRKATSSQV